MSMGPPVSKTPCPLRSRERKKMERNLETVDQRLSQIFTDGATQHLKYMAKDPIEQEVVIHMLLQGSHTVTKYCDIAGTSSVELRSGMRLVESKLRLAAYNFGSISYGRELHEEQHKLALNKLQGQLEQHQRKVKTLEAEVNMLQNKVDSLSQSFLGRDTTEHVAKPGAPPSIMTCF